MGRHPDLAAMAVAAEAAALSHDAAGAAHLYDALRPYEDLRVPAGASRAAGACIAYHLGLVAAAVGRDDVAVRHLERALATHVAAGDELWAARARIELARVFLGRRNAEDLDRARTQLEAVRAWTLAATVPKKPSGTNLIRQDGEVWTIVYEGEALHLRDSKGLGWLALLLRHPDRDFPAQALAGDREEPADGTPRSRAVERARIRVTRALRGVIARIAAQHESLGRHLSTTVRTGRVCVYEPDPRLPIDWGG